MGLFKQVAIFIGCLSFAVFVAFFGRLPIFRGTPIGFLHRLIWVYIPNGFARFDRLLTGGRLEASFNRTSDYLLYTRHSIVLVFFLLLLIIGEFLFVPPALRLIPATFPSSAFSRGLQYMLLPGVIIPPYILVYLCRIKESKIGPHNHHAAMTTYPFDHTIFQPSPTYLNPACRTCHLPKPARSKHCSICNACIQKADHHCVWINNCVGRNNYIFFIALMLSLSNLLAYGAYLGYTVLDTQIQLRDGRFPGEKPHWSKGLTWKNFGLRFSNVLPDHPLIAAPALLCFSCFPLAMGLFGYHIYLIWAGMTTNESAKWAELQEDIAEGRVWKARIDDLAGDQTLGLGPTTNFTEYPDAEGRSMQNRGGDHPSEWPISPGWCVVRMEYPDRRPRIKTERLLQRNSGQRHETRQKTSSPNFGEPECGVGEWQDDERWLPVHTIQDVHNIYDQGFRENLSDWITNRE